ncbi:MAG: hypothetical protein WDN29_10970 [Methylovirgula sp.]
MRSGELDCFHTASRLHRPIAVRFQEVVEKLHVKLIIFDDQNALLHLLGTYCLKGADVPAVRPKHERDDYQTEIYEMRIGSQKQGRKWRKSPSSGAQNLGVPKG